MISILPPLLRPGSNSYSAGSILDTGSNSATDFVGGFIGGAWDNWSGMSISNSYYDVTTSGLSIACEEYGPCSGATGLTDPQMKQSSSFTGWDFTNTWVQTNGETYPLLRALSVIIDFEGSQLILSPSEIGGWGMISAINNFYNDGGSCANMGSCHHPGLIKITQKQGGKIVEFGVKKGYKIYKYYKRGKKIWENPEEASPHDIQEFLYETLEYLWDIFLEI